MSKVFIVTCQHNPTFYAVFNNFNDALESIKYSYHATNDLKVTYVTSNVIELSFTDWQGLYYQHTFTINQTEPLVGIHHL